MVAISPVTIVCILISTLISILFPIAYLLVGKIKMKGSLLSALFSLPVFLLVFLLQALIWSALNLDDVLVKLLGTENSDGVIAAIRCVYMGLLETAGIWLYFLIGRKKLKKAGDAVTFGAGYAVWGCLIFSVLLVMAVLVVISNAMGKEVKFLFSQLYIDNRVVSKSDVEFLYYGLRSLFDAVFYLSVSMMLFVSVQQKLKWPVPVVLLLHVVQNVPVSFSDLHIWYWGNGIVTMIAVGLITLITCLIAYKLYLNYYKKSRKGE